MAKTAVRERQKKRLLLCNKYREVRLNLKTIISSTKSSDTEKWDAMLKLQSYPPDSSRTKLRNRCNLCGRPRAFNRRTGLCRIHHRTVSLKGFIPGERKASW